MSNELMLNLNQPTNLPAYLLGGSGVNVSGQLMASIGDSRNRIGLKGSRFRQILNGKEEGVFDENYLDIILVGAVPTVSRVYYAQKFNSASGAKQKSPACYAVDTNDGPPPDVQHPQSSKCEICPQNVKGSAISESGQKTRACGFFRRIAFFLAGDMTGTLYYCDIKSMGLFGESNKALNKFNLNDYAKALKSHGVDASQVVTRISFDTDQSVPKLLFQPLRVITVEEKAVITKLVDGNEITDYTTINMSTVDISGEESAVEEDVAAPAAPAAPAAQPVAQAPRPQAPKATPVAQKPQPVAQAPRPQAPKATPVAQKPQQAALVIEDVTPPVEAAPVQQTVQRPAVPPVQKPAAVSHAQNPAPVSVQPVVQEVSSDAELADILGNLGL